MRQRRARRRPERELAQRVCTAGMHSAPSAYTQRVCTARVHSAYAQRALDHGVGPIGPVIGCRGTTSVVGVTVGAPGARLPESGEARTVPTQSRARRAYLDNLKVVLVACVILGHAFITYGDIGSWVYREPAQNEAFTLLANVFVALGSLFAMGLFFLIAGLLTPGPLRRKGLSGFLRDRLVRLGIPFVAYLLLVYPLAAWAGGQGAETALGALGEAWTRLDPGPLWFVGVLLLYSTGYGLWRAARPAAATPGPFRSQLLAWFAAAIAAGDLVVRLWFPMNSDQPFSAHLWQWPQCLALFVLGVLCAERGWLQPIPTRVRRIGGWATLVGIAAVVTSMVTATGPDAFVGGLTWQAALTSACEGVIAVGLSVWMLGTFERHVDHAGPVSRALGRAAFGAYVLQAPVLLCWALLVRDLAIAPEVKFLILAPAGIATSFALSWLLTRLPGVRRVL